MLDQVTKKRISQSVYLCGFFVTILINPWGNYDPINPIKVTALAIFSFFSAGLVLSQFSKLKNFLPFNFLLYILFFILWLFVSFIASGAPKTQQFWGMFGRNTGVLTYLSLTFLILASAMIQDLKNYVVILRVFLMVSFFETVYAFIQIGKQDPLNWSIFDIFGTLGNANFLSAFLGMSSLVTASLILVKKNQIANRIFLIIFLLMQLFVLRTTSSIQGMMLFAGGLVILGFVYIYYQSRLKILRLPYLVISTVILVFTSMALFNSGPLKKFIYQETIIYRTDYWHAGWKMTILKPIFGVGIDSYGDWYRTVRGSISATRTDPNRTANTAHNIYLDISSGGGMPLLVFYLAILFIALIMSIKYLKNQIKYDAIFVAYFSAWIGFQIQSLISINQVGVGVWGWIFTGVLVGYTRGVGLIGKKNSEVDSKNYQEKNAKKIKSSKQQMLKPGVFLTAFSLLLVGLALSVPPLLADSKFRSASNMRDLNKMIAASKMTGATAWHITQVIEAASKSNYLPQAIELDQNLISRFPRDFYGWRVAASDIGLPEKIHLGAIKKVLELDPDNPDLDIFKE